MMHSHNLSLNIAILMEYLLTHKIIILMQIIIFKSMQILLLNVRNSSKLVSHGTKYNNILT